MYTYTLRKELSVELTRGWLSGEGGEKRFGQLDKPCIFTIQGSYRGVPWWQTGAVWGEKEEGEPRLYVHLFLGAWVVRGGVTGRPEFTPPYWYLAFFSEGFRIFKTQTQRNVSLSVHTHTPTHKHPKKANGFHTTWKEHMRDSSTLIIPPALSNSPQ